MEMLAKLNPETLIALAALIFAVSCAIFAALWKLWLFFHGQSTTKREEQRERDKNISTVVEKTRRLLPENDLGKKYGYAHELIESGILELSSPDILLAMNRFAERYGVWPTVTPKSVFRVGGKRPSDDKWNPSKSAHIWFWILNQNRWYIKAYRRLRGSSYKPYPLPKFAQLVSRWSANDEYYDPKEYFEIAAKTTRVKRGHITYIPNGEVLKVLLNRHSGGIVGDIKIPPDEQIKQILSSEPNLKKAWNFSGQETISEAVVEMLNLKPTAFDAKNKKGIEMVVDAYLHGSDPAKYIHKLLIAGALDLATEDAINCAIVEIARQNGRFPFQTTSLATFLEIGTLRYLRCAEMQVVHETDLGNFINEDRIKGSFANLLRVASHS